MGGRYLSALVLANRFPEARVVHSGGGGSARSGESRVAASILLGSGIAPDRLTFEDRSRNTCENAAFSKERVDPDPEQRWLLVTSAAGAERVAAGCAAGPS